tara:strand:- start:1033 stop:1467 length:435 start_codon:yes stop_codon:yes gene_type:complete
MITINEIIDLFDSFWTTNKRMPGVIPKRMLENGTMYWEVPQSFADKVHTWKDKKPIRINPSNKDIDNYWIATELGLTIDRAARDLVYLRHRGWSYRKLGFLHKVSHETIRNRYLGIIVDLVNNINAKTNGDIKRYILLTTTHNI